MWKPSWITDPHKKMKIRASLSLQYRQLSQKHEDRLLGITVRVLLFLDTNFRGFYKLHRSMGGGLEFEVSNTTGNNLWGNCILLVFNFRGLSEP